MRGASITDVFQGYMTTPLGRHSTQLHPEMCCHTKFEGANGDLNLMIFLHIFFAGRRLFSLRCLNFVVPVFSKYLCLSVHTVHLYVLVLILMSVRVYIIRSPIFVDTCM